MCVEVLPVAAPQVSLPAVIMCHGFAYFKEEGGLFTDMAAVLAQQGYTVYYFDFSGCGESDGDYKDTSLTKLVADLESVLKVVTGFSYINQQELSLVGQSFGTNVCVAAKVPNIKRMVLCGAFDNPHELLSSLFPDFDETKTVTRDRDDGRKTTLEPGFWKDIKQYDLPRDIATLSCPILFIHGELDDIVPLESGKRLVGYAQNATLEIIHKSNHVCDQGIRRFLPPLLTSSPRLQNSWSIAIFI